MDWQIFLFVIIAGLLFSLLVFVLESSALAGKGIRETLRDLWQAFFGK